MILVFPFIPGKFYSQIDIREKLKLRNFGGIRSSIKNNLIAVFMNAPKPISSKYKFGNVNVYQDYYNKTTGLYHYTGEGQIGDQKLTNSNLTLAKAGDAKRKIHFFRQHNVGLEHEYIGEVEVIERGTAKQKDQKGNEREVIVFYLKPFSKIITSEEEAVSREAESRIGTDKKSKRNVSEIEADLDEINKKIIKKGPKKGIISKNAEQNKREIEIIILLKELYEKCMVCKVPHFKKENNVGYSEVHHLIPWSISYDDSRENLVVLCPTCHKKFDHAKISEKISMYNQLIENFSDLKFKKPSYIKN